LATELVNQPESSGGHLSVKCSSPVGHQRQPSALEQRRYPPR